MSSCTGSSTPSNTPTSSIASANNHRSFDGALRPVSPATAADLAAAMPGSPISSPMYAHTRYHTCDGSNHSSVRRTTPTIGSPVHTSATVDVVQLQQMLDAYYVEQHQKLAEAAAGAAPAEARAGAAVMPASVVSMNGRAAAPASPVAAAGWGAGAVGAASMSGAAPPPRSLPAYPRCASAPGKDPYAPYIFCVLVWALRPYQLVIFHTLAASRSS